MPLGAPGETNLNGGDLRSPSTPAPRRSGPRRPVPGAPAGGAFGPGAQQQTATGAGGPIAPNRIAERGSPYSGFAPTPEYSSQGAWSGWGDAGPTSGNAANRAGQGVHRGVTGLFGNNFTVQDYYTLQHGEEAVEQAMRSGLDPAVYFSMKAPGQEAASAWGTNLPNAGKIIGQQENAFDFRLQGQQNRDDLISSQSAYQNNMRDQYLQQYGTNMAMTYELDALAREQMRQGYRTDKGILEQQKFRATELAKADNSAGLLHNSNMRGVLDTERGLVGDEFSNRQNNLNNQTVNLNDTQRLSFDQYGVNDAFQAGRAQDLMAQYGFNARGFANEQEGLFADRATQMRANASNAAASGAFSSAGFGDNNQDILGQYSRGMDANTLSLDQRNQALDEQNRAIGNNRENLSFGQQNAQIGFRQEGQNIDFQQDQNRLNTEGRYNQLTGQYSANDLQRSQLMSARKGIDSLAKEYGLRGQDLRNQLDNALTGMDIDVNQATIRLGEMLNSQNAQESAAAMQFMQQVASMQ